MKKRVKSWVPRLLGAVMSSLTMEARSRGTRLMASSWLPLVSPTTSHQLSSFLPGYLHQRHTMRSWCWGMRSTGTLGVLRKLMALRAPTLASYFGILSYLGHALDWNVHSAQEPYGALMQISHAYALALASAQIHTSNATASMKECLPALWHACRGHTQLRACSETGPRSRQAERIVLLGFHHAPCTFAGPAK